MAVELTTAPGSAAGARGADAVVVDVPSTPGSDSQQLAALLDLSEGVAPLFQLVAKHTPPMPDVHIEWENLSYHVERPADDGSIPNVASAAVGTITGLLGAAKKKTSTFHVLNNVSGYLRPGTLTLLLAPPGHGKSAMMKALAGRISSSKLAGKVWYGGRSPSEINVARLVNYVDQTDIHLPLLSVEESLDFAQKAWNGSRRDGFDEVMYAADAKKLETVLRLLGLHHVKDTPVGNAMIRGVSGGEKKRVTIGEMIMPNYRAIFLDEISTGLDSAATLDITRLISGFVKTFRATAMAALLQPSPEVFRTFDDVMLMREGQIIYHGPQDQLVPYFEEMGLVFPVDQDLADFITEFISDPKAIYRRQMRRLARSGGAVPKNVPPLDTDGLVLYFKASLHREKWGILRGKDEADTKVTTDAAATDGAKADAGVGETKHDGEGVGTGAGAAAGAGAVGAVLSDDEDGVDEYKLDDAGRARTRTLVAGDSVATEDLYLNPHMSDYSKQMYVGDHAGQSMWTMTKLLLKRQWTVQIRNKGFLGPRIGQAVFMGLVLGTLFFDLDTSEAGLKFGLLFFSSIFLSFANLSEVPIAAEAKLVVYKQTNAKFYSTGAYVCSVLLTHLPIATLETVIFGTITYWMCGFASEGTRYLTFLLLVWLTSLVMSNVFRLFAFVAPNEDVAQSMVGPCVGLCLLFGGFLITVDKIPTWLVWIYWATPFSWIIRALVINEFKSSDYDQLVPGTVPGTTTRLGDAFMSQLDVEGGMEWVWGAVIYLIIMYILMSILNAVVLSKVRYDPSVGTSRATADELDSPTLRYTREHRAMTSVKPRSMSISAATTTNDLPFEPMTLSFTNLRYTVKVPAPSGKGTVDKELLKGVSGVARPKQLIALMGSSGAGKTTLMDVIAGRKTGGHLQGEIRVNGHLKEPKSFARIMGYVEQFDLLMPYATVRETLHFASRLRLDPNVSASRRYKFVESVLEMMELGQVADRLVGDETTSSGISAGERKRLSIGVELVASPTILFLDEPTSGLDSRAAAAVMRVVKRVADTGRTVVCTIHQPSSELFFMFDSLLLLKKGGEVVYFGSVENRAKDLVSYLTAIPGTPPLPQRVNPADWMLDVIGAGIGLSFTETADYAAVYKASPLCAANKTAIENAAKPKPGSKPIHFSGTYATGLGTQLAAVVGRELKSAWRNVPLNFTRLVIYLVLAGAFGLLFSDLDTSDRAGLNSLSSFCFVVNLFLGIISMTTAMPVLARARSIFYRERASNTYASFAYSTGIFLAELPFAAVNVTIFHLITYWLVGLKDEAGVFLHYLLVSYLLVVSCICLGQLLMSALPNKEAGQIAGGVVISLINLFGGFFIPRPAIADGWIWMYWGNPASYAFQALTALQFYCSGPDCPTVVDPASTGSIVPVPASDLMGAYLGFNYDDRWVMTIGVGAWVIGLHVFTALALGFINHLKR